MGVPRIAAKSLALKDRLGRRRDPRNAFSNTQAQSVTSSLYGRFPSNVGNRSTPEYLSETATLMDGWSDAPSGGA